MDRELDDALQALKEATKFAESYCFEFDDWYLSAIAQLENHPANQPGTDKTWVTKSLASFRGHYAAVRKRSPLG